MLHVREGMSDTTDPPRPTRASTSLRRLLVAVALVAVFALGVSWWRAPNSSWACGSDDRVSGCIGEVTLDLDSVDLTIDPGEVRLAFHGFDISPDGTEVAVGFEPMIAGSKPGGAFVAIFDTATGTAVRTIYEAGLATYGDASVGSVVFSPDGSQLAVERWADGEHAVEIIDLDTLASTTVLRSERGEGVGCVRLGLSPDSSLLQCSGAIFEVATSRLVEQLNDETRFVDSSYRDWAWSRTGITAEISGVGDDRHLVVRQPSGDVLIEQVDPFRWLQRVSFDPQATRLVVVSERPDPWALWSLDGPRRSHADVLTAVYDTVSGERLRTFERRSADGEIAWTASGSAFAALDLDLHLSVFEF